MRIRLCASQSALAAQPRRWPAAAPRCCATSKSRPRGRQAVLSRITMQPQTVAALRSAKPAVLRSLRRRFLAHPALLAPRASAAFYPISRRGSNVLDLGCGNGRFLAFLRDSGWQGGTSAMDSSAGLLAEAAGAARAAPDPPLRSSSRPLIDDWPTACAGRGLVRRAGQPRRAPPHPWRGEPGRVPGAVARNCWHRRRPDPLDLAIHDVGTAAQTADGWEAAGISGGQTWSGAITW